MTRDTVPRILVGAKRTCDYVFDALARLNSRDAQVTLCAVGSALPKCNAVAGVLAQKFSAEVVHTKIVPYARRELPLAGMEITLAAGPLQEAPESYRSLRNDGFIEYPVYELLFNSFLTAKNALTIEIEDVYSGRVGRRGVRKSKSDSRLPALVITRDDGLDYKITVPDQLTAPTVAKITREEVLADVATALSRSGILLSRSWEDVLTTLCRDDDAIIGLDTNVLRECIVSQQLLDGLIFNSPHWFVQAPNWLLFIIPNAVMHEIEQLANSRDTAGKLTQSGRLGYRALAEILELDQSRDLGGISLLVVGEADPVLDARVELRGLRTDMRSRSRVVAALRRISVGDTHVRDQFKQFLRQISFHKGTYFLTADKSNSALARAEGLSSVYFAPALSDAVQKAGMLIRMPRILDDGGPPLTVPLGKIIFELAVQCERIWLTAGETRICVEADLAGESLINWVHKRLKIRGVHLKALIENYSLKPRVPLVRAEEVWRELVRATMDEEAID